MGDCSNSYLFRPILRAAPNDLIKGGCVFLRDLTRGSCALRKELGPPHSYWAVIELSRSNEENVYLIILRPKLNSETRINALSRNLMNCVTQLSVRTSAKRPRTPISSYNIATNDPQFGTSFRRGGAWYILSHLPWWIEYIVGNCPSRYWISIDCG